MVVNTMGKISLEHGPECKAVNTIRTKGMVEINTVMDKVRLSFSLKREPRNDDVMLYESKY